MELDLHLPKPMSPESDTDTTDNAPPLLQAHLSKALSLSTNHHHHNGTSSSSFSLLKPRHPQPQQNAAGAVSYKECLKNHAAKLGGLALDGCGEFMQSPAASPRDPSSLKCAACGCHRNFHRRDHPQPPLLLWATGSPVGPENSNNSSGPNSPTGTTTTTTTSSPTPYHAAFPPVPFHYGGGGVGPKRARTKFTQEQKARMQAFAERLGWRMARGPTEEKLVEEFCGEVGVRRNVFKVWMHNNKHRKDVFNNNNSNSNKGNFGNSVDIKEEEEERLVGGGDGYQVVERKVFGSISSPSSS